MENNRNNSYGRRGGASSGRARGGGRGSSHDHQSGGRGHHGTNRGSHHQSPAPRDWVNRAPILGNQPPVQHVPPQIRPPQQQQQQQRQQQQQQQHQFGAGASGGRTSAWTGRPWRPSPPTPHGPASPLPQSQGIRQPSADEPSIQKVKVSDQKSPSSSSDSKKSQIQAIRRPDRGGTNRVRSIGILVNHFRVRFDPSRTMYHYHVEVKRANLSDGRRVVQGKMRKSDMRFIKEKLYSGEAVMPVYDGEKNLFSPLRLEQESHTVVIPDGEDTRSGSYTFNIKLVNELKFSELEAYFSGNLPYIPRGILQGMDLVMKDNPSRRRIRVGRSFYSCSERDDLSRGLVACRGFQQSLKPTSQHLALCLDSSVLAFRKSLPVIEFLEQQISDFKLTDIGKWRREVNEVLEGLLVTVTHRPTKQKYTIAGLTEENACEVHFTLLGQGENPPEDISLLQYFKSKWDAEVEHKDIPCLELGTRDRPNKVPLEFCVLVEGQRYPKESLVGDAGASLKRLSLAKPSERRNTINRMVKAEDGPCGGDVAQQFGIGVDTDMTTVVGRVIKAPQLKLRNSFAEVDKEKCQWNLVGRTLLDGKSLECWGLLEFIDDNHCGGWGRRRGQASEFVKNLKWVAETRIGVATQCYLSHKAADKKGQDQYLGNLCLKINAKLGGCNFEVSGKLLNLSNNDHVMFIGADVNHPKPMNTSCPSIAAVVGTVNWPAANRYAARILPQAHRKEEIVNFGSMCMDLVNTYEEMNQVRPTKIVIFRDGVSEGQFEMALDEELHDLRDAFSNQNYSPRITLIVAQKRHLTRLFVEDERVGGRSGNVPPGTVVDTVITHPFEFDFYLCSHYGSLGTSKPTHYYVLKDENSFTSDELQKLIYDMCFTFARCTKPVSVVPPVYYADLAAYRGRMYQESVMGRQSPTQCSTRASSFDESQYKMRGDMKNAMFFI